MLSLGIADWERLDPLDRHAIANQLLPDWPAVSEVLSGAVRARQIAGAPPREFVKRRTRAADERHFVMRLASFLRGKGFAEVPNGTLARITNVAFRRKGRQDVNVLFVRDALRGMVE